MKPPRWENRLGAALLLAGALWAVWTAWPRYRLGAYGDDAYYALGAVSLSQGHYRDLVLPGEPPHTAYLPGFPALLAPAAAVFGPSERAFRLVVLLLTLAAQWLVWRFLGAGLSPFGRWVLLGLLVLNPILNLMSTQVMAEPAFLLALTAALIFLDKTGRDPRRGNALRLGLAAGFAGVARPEGIFLLPMAAAALAVTRRGKAALWAAGAGGVLLAAVHGRVWWLSKSGGAYTGQLSDNLPVLLQNLGSLLAHARGFFIAAALETLLPFRIASLAVPLAMAGWALVGAGLWRWSHRRVFPLPVFAVGAGFLALYSLIHVVWGSYDERYVLVLVPFIAAAAVAGAEALAEKYPRARRARWLAALPFAAAVAHGLQGRARPIPPRTVPVGTYAWIRRELPPGSVLMSSLPGPARWHAGLPGYFHLATRGGLDDFLAGMDEKGITHVMVQWNRFMSYSMYERGDGPADSVAHSRRLTEGAPAFFQRVYADPVEETAVYRALTPPRFHEAYGIYGEAVRDFLAGDIGAARAKLDRALAIVPRFPAALNARGLVHIKAKDFRRALPLVAQAAALDPLSVPAHKNWADALRALGENKKAAEVEAVLDRLAREQGYR